MALPEPILLEIVEFVGPVCLEANRVDTVCQTLRRACKLYLWKLRPFTTLSSFLLNLLDVEAYTFLFLRRKTTQGWLRSQTMYGINRHRYTNTMVPDCLLRNTMFRLLRQYLSLGQVCVEIYREAFQNGHMLTILAEYLSDLNSRNFTIVTRTDRDNKVASVFVFIVPFVEMWEHSRRSGSILPPVCLAQCFTAIENYKQKKSKQQTHHQNGTHRSSNWREWWWSESVLERVEKNG